MWTPGKRRIGEAFQLTGVKRSQLMPGDICFDARDACARLSVNQVVQRGVVRINGFSYENLPFLGSAGRNPHNRFFQVDRAKAPGTPLTHSVDEALFPLGNTP